MTGYWGAPGDHEAGLGLGGGSPREGLGLFSPESDAPGDVEHPRLEGAEVSPLPPLLFAEAVESFGLVRQSLSVSLGVPGWEAVTWNSSGASQPAAVPVGGEWMWGPPPLPWVQLRGQLGDAACEPCAGSWCLLWSSTWRIN